MKLNRSAFIQPNCLSPGVATGHIPFVAWLIETLKPRVLVELGTFRGESYLACCQTVRECNIRTRCFAAGPWQAPDTPVEFQDDIFNTLNRQNSAYDSFSRLIRASYAAAASQFDDGSIDLLQLPMDADFDALENIMALWRPKLSADGVVLLQGIDATLPARGRFWEALSRGQTSFEFKHNKGLGIVFGNAAIKAGLALEASPEQARLTEMLFDRLTFAIENQSAHEWTRLELELTAMEGREAMRKLQAGEQAQAVLENDIRALASAHAAELAQLRDEAESEKAALRAQMEDLQRGMEQLRGENARQLAENTATYASLSETRGKLAEMGVSLESALRNLGESEARRAALEAELAQFWARVGTSIHGMGNRLWTIAKLPQKLLAHEGAKRPVLTRYLIQPGKIGWRGGKDA